MNVLIGPYTENETPRQIEIRIDPFDTYSADHTLALIIAPLLKALKHDKYGAPLVCDEDVPDHLRSTAAPEPEHEWDIDDNHFKRWDWVLDEMIWAMEQIALDDDSKFYDHSEVDDNADLDTQLKQIKVDRVALEQHHRRIVNGCELFGKYFQSLWS
jgi:hypothetical protein